jgi:ABC-2 type transport system ATP-binding protein
MTSNPATLSISNLSVTRGARPVLNGLSLSVKAGEIYALLGGNGAGKSTAIAALLGFVAASDGTMHVCGDDALSDAETVRRKLAYLPENVALYEHLTARENLDYFLALSGDHRAPDEIEAALNATGLQAEARGRRLSGFSKGMRQKVAIALAVLRKVPLLVLDEPTSGLDPKATADFNRLIQQLKAQGTAILMVTHDLLGAADCADRIGFLSDGHIVEEVTATGPDRFDIGALHHCYGQAVAA